MSIRLVGVAHAVAVAAMLGLCVRSAPAADPLQLAVLDFDYVAADSDAAHLGKGLQQMLTTDLRKVGGLPMIERGRLRDVLKELRLSETPLVDSEQAVKIGRLAGATHLVTGGIVIDAGKMRIDAKIVAVETGKVLLAEQVSGDRDAFWELEKDLVKLVADRLGLKPTPAERADISRVHTARFENFAAFSDAIDLADRRQYPDAIAALKRLSETDEDFALAKATLADYEQLLRKLEARALALQEQKDQLVLNEANEQARAESRALADLAKVVALPVKTEDDRLRRCEALYLLARAYGGSNYCPGLRQVADHFAMARAASHYNRLYWSEAVELFPKIPPLIGAYEFFQPYGSENFLSAARHGRIVTTGNEELRLFRVKPEGYFKSCMQLARYDSLQTFCDRLEIDLPQRIRVVESILKMLIEEKRILVEDDEGEEVICNLWRWLANAHRGNADFAASTACFTKLALRYKDSGEVKQIMRDIETDKRLAQAFEAFPDKVCARECAALIWGSDNYGLHFDADNLLDCLERPGDRQHRIHEMRQLRFGYAIDGHESMTYYMSGQPIWLVRRGHSDVCSGLRTGAFSFDILEYFHKRPDRNSAPEQNPTDPTLLVTEGVRRDNADFGCTFDVRRPGNSQRWDSSEEDFVAAIDQSESLLSTQVGFMFGVRDVHSQSRKACPMRGEAVLLGKGRVEYVRFMELNDEPGTTSHPTPFRFDVIAQAPCDVTGILSHEMRIVLGPNEVTAKINGREHRFARKEPETGFVGLVLNGPGYVKVSKLTSVRPADAAQPAAR